MSDPEYIKAGWLIDGSGRPVEKHVLLTIVNGIVTDISTFADTLLPDPQYVTDFSQCTLLPTLVDCHVHLSLSSTIDEQARKKQLTASFSEIRNQISQNIHSHLTHGILAVRDGGDRHGHVLRYCKECAGINREKVMVKPVGKAWHKQGRYGKMLGSHPGEGESLAHSVARETQQVDFIKIIQSGPNSLKEFGKETAPQFDREDLRNSVQFAEQHGKKVMVHANGKDPVRMAIEAGCHSIEHGYFMGRENLKRMAESQTVWVPTLYAMQACADTIDKKNNTAERDVAEKTLDHQLEQVAMARELGVRIVLGTDAGCKGVSHGKSYVEEIKLLMDAGCSLPETVMCASQNGAHLMGVENKLGRIAKGKPATFLVVRGAPDQLPRHLSSLEAIYLQGSPCGSIANNKG